MVARGEEQKANVDFGELFAPTVAVSSVRLLTAMACELDLDLRHFDIEQAFVQSDLENDVFMRLPQGRGRLSERIVTLNKRLYGLKQASRQWHAHLTRCLLTFEIFAVSGRPMHFPVDGRRTSSEYHSGACG